MPPGTVPTMMASKPVNLEFIQGLEVMENKIYPLQGATGERQTRDSRLSTFVGSGFSTGSHVCYYEHMATIRHTPIQTYYIVFRQTMDAILLEQADPVKYPKWLMDHPVKDDSRSIFIHVAKPNAPALLKKGVGNIGEWLDEITNDLTFNSLARFCLTSGVFTDKMYGSFR